VHGRSINSRREQAQLAFVLGLLFGDAERQRAGLQDVQRLFVHVWLFLNAQKLKSIGGGVQEIDRGNKIHIRRRGREGGRGR